MKIFKLLRNNIICLALFLIFSNTAFGQTDLVKTEGITSPLHQANTGRITFMAKPMDDKKEVGKNWNYFTSGVVVLGDIINKSVPGGLEKYADKKLFKPLGITKYEWQYTPQKVPSTAGGLRMSALDFAKFGQLYENGGKWNGKQIIPRNWVDKTFTKYLTLPYDESWHYGYLFWNMTYNVNNKPYEAFYATGNGGNKIFVFKDQPLVVVITATAYNKGWAHAQANKIMEKYILPAIVK